MLSKPDLTMFRELSDHAWATLMLGAVSLPPLPPDELQRNWCGSAGAPLARQTADFYRLLKDSYARHGRKPLAESIILDFGCGWGRITRMFARDLQPEQVFGCDTDPKILEWCRGLPGTFRHSDVKPQRLPGPFAERFDLVFAFSVFTHLGPRTHQSALDALHASLAPDGLMVVTIRPRGFLEVRGSELGHLSAEAIDRLLRAYDAGEFVYHPCNMPPVEDEVPYGEAVIPLAYVEKYWTDRFEIIDIPDYASDPYQLPLILCRKSSALGDHDAI